MALRKRITNKALKNAKWLVLNKKDYLYQALIEYLDSDLNALEINNIDKEPPVLEVKYVLNERNNKNE